MPCLAPAGHGRHSPRSMRYGHCLPATFLCSTVERERERDRLRSRQFYTAQPLRSLWPCGGRLHAFCRPATYATVPGRCRMHDHYLPAVFLCATIDRYVAYTPALPPPISRSSMPRSPLTQWHITRTSSNRSLATAGECVYDSSLCCVQCK